jgi:ATP-dependent helicase HrpA
VSLRLLDSAVAASETTRAGLRRLFMLQLREEFRYIERTLADMDRLCLFYATIGRCDDLKEEIVLAIADRAFFGDDATEVRTREDFGARAAGGWRRLSAASAEVQETVLQTLEAYHELGILFSGDSPPFWSDSVRDMKDQLARLISRGFVIGTPYERLRELPRYLRGITVRFKKLANAGLTRDVLAMEEVRPLWERFKREESRGRESGLRIRELEELRWMIEELRISLFAQELKATIPISVQRIQKALDAIRT